MKTTREEVLTDIIALYQEMLDTEPSHPYGNIYEVEFENDDQRCGVMIDTTRGRVQITAGDGVHPGIDMQYVSIYGFLGFIYQTLGI